MTTADDLRALSAAATPGPWYTTPLGSLMSTATKAPVVVTLNRDPSNRDLIVWLRNHADALADLIDAAHGVDANVDPAVTGNALRDALAALEADQ